MSALSWLDLYFGPPKLQDEAVDLPQRTTLNFVGPGVTATDDPTNARTLVTIPGAGGAVPAGTGARAVAGGVETIRALDLAVATDITGVAPPGKLAAQVGQFRTVRGVVAANVANLASFAVAGNDGLTYAQGQRVLLTAQTTASQNGIYVVGAVTAGNAPLTLATDWATSLVTGDTWIAISEGTAGAHTAYRVTTQGAIVVGTTALALSAVAFGLGTIPAGTGLRHVAGGIETVSLVVDADVGAGAAIAVTKLAPPGTPAQVLGSVGSTPTWQTPAGDWRAAVAANEVIALTGDTGITTIRAASPYLQWATATVSPFCQHQPRATDAATTALTVRAQDAFATAVTNTVGGALNLSSGSGATPGAVNLQAGGTTVASLTTAEGIIFGATQPNPFVQQTRRVATSLGGFGMSIVAQAGSTLGNADGGALTLGGGLRTGTGVDGAVRIYNGVAQIFEYSGGAAYSAFYGPSATDCAESKIYSASTTSGAALQTIATIPLTAGVVTQLAVIVVGRSGSDFVTFSASKSYYNNAGAVASDTNTGDSLVNTGKTAAALDPTDPAKYKLLVSGTNVLVQVTPWTAATTNWRVYPQAVRL